MSIRPLSHLSASVEERILACVPTSGKARLTGPTRFLILRKEAAMKKILIGLFIVIVLLIAGLLALPFLVDLASYQDQYKPLIERALNRKIELKGIRLTIWPRIGARVVGFTVMDDPSFSGSP